MPLPIIVIPERHWDSAPKKVLSASLKRLRLKGYSTICFESPEDESESDLLKGVQSTIEFIKKRKCEATHYLERAGVSLESAVEQDYSQLAKLLRLFVSSQHYREMSLWFKELPGLESKLSLIENAKEEGFSIKGIDLPQDKLEPLRSLGAQSNLSSRVEIIDMLEEHRCNRFVNNIVKFQNNGQGVIFIVGQSHFKKITELMDDHLMNDEVIYFHPYITKSLDSSLPDTHRYLEREHTVNVHFIDATVIEPKDVISASNKLLKKIADMKPLMYRKIDSTCAATRLRLFTGLPFQTYARPSLYVDCLIPVTSDSMRAIQKLQKKNINSRLTFFDGSLQYCIPNVNLPKNIEKIQMLNIDKPTKSNIK